MQGKGHRQQMMSEPHPIPFSNIRHGMPEQRKETNACQRSMMAIDSLPPRALTQDVGRGIILKVWKYALTQA